LETLAYFSVGCRWLVLAGGATVAQEISTYSVEARTLRRLADRGNEAFLGDTKGFHLIAPVNGIRTRIEVQMGVHYALMEGVDTIVPLALRPTGDLLYLARQEGVTGLFRANGYSDQNERVAQSVEIVASAYHEDDDVFAWIEGAGIEDRRLRMTSARGGGVLELSVPALGFVGEVGGEPHASHPASVGPSWWVFFTRAGPAGEALLDAWQPRSGTHRRLSDDAVWDVQVDPHESNVAWMELGGLHLANMYASPAGGRVTDDAFQFRFAGDWLVWVGYDQRLRALPLAD
jgi:hypothetical protein